MIYYCVFLLVVSGYFFIDKLVQFFLMVHRCFQMRELRQTPALAIRVSNVSYNRKNNLIIMFSGIVTTVCCFYLSKHSSGLAFRYGRFVSVSELRLLAVTFLFFALMDLFLVLMNLIEIFLGEDAFLTPDGVVAAGGMYRKEKYQYKIDYEQNGPEQYKKFISIYKKKIKAPYRFEILEREDIVIRWVNTP